MFVCVRLCKGGWVRLTSGGVGGGGVLIIPQPVFGTLVKWFSST